MNKLKLISVFFFLTFTFALQAQQVQFFQTEHHDTLCLVLQNNLVRQTITLVDNTLAADTLQTLKPFAAHYHRPQALLVTDAGFAFNVVWTGLRAPGKNNNAENPVLFTKKDFRFDHFTVSDSTPAKQVNLFFKGINNPFAVRLSYKLQPEKFYARRQTAISDPKLHGHFLDRMDVLDGKAVFEEKKPAGKQTAGISIEGMHFAYTEKIKLGGGNDESFHILKNGGFGQPLAFANKNSGGFFGLEYPVATTEASVLDKNLFSVNSYRYVGKRIGQPPIASPWEVMAVTPQPYVKKWFFSYVKDIRVAPAKPYILYNSWYDLRSERYARVDKDIPKDAVMNDTNTLRIIRLLQKNMVGKHHIHLNAFVLDDGWDNYESAWALNRHEFPHGLRPLADTLAKTGTRLGIWFGPMGGYSFAMSRVKWMGEHGYEVTGHKYVYGSAKLCLAGKKYSDLFRKRITDFVKNDRMGYFKWDGIQFSCSNPAHGHPTGIYSGNAVMQSVIDKCKAVRAIDSSVYLNITTGTWLSPWWLQYANQIWMDAADYAFSDVPSISRRDNAMTYRDYALYDDFKVRNMWIPMANLMTHGIIKGRLENISKGGEPMDRFTNNAVLYFARGITMWELYISPDILTPAEWNVLSQAIHWAESEQEVMANTSMVGGNPAQGAPYGYIHFKGKKGLIAVRNPKVEADTLRLYLNPAYGLDEGAAGLVVEQIYPRRRILPDLYSAGGLLTIPLDGFETALFNVFPLEGCHRPLLADAVFTLRQNGNQLDYKVYETGPRSRFLVPQNIQSIERTGGENKKAEGFGTADLPAKIKAAYRVSVQKTRKNFVYRLSPKDTTDNYPGEVALLLQHPATENFPEVTARQNGKPLAVKKQHIKGKWAWYAVKPEKRGVGEIIFTLPAGWHGESELWVYNIRQEKPLTLSVTTKSPAGQRQMPPMPYPPSERRNYVLVKKTVQ